MNSDNDDKRKSSKVQRRKSRSERNRLKNKQHTAGIDVKEKEIFKKTVNKVSNTRLVRKKVVKDCFEATGAVFGNSRLTRRLNQVGLFNKVKASETIVHDKSNILDSNENQTEAQAIDIIDISPEKHSKPSANNKIIKTFPILDPQDFEMDIDTAVNKLNIPHKIVPSKIESTTNRNKSTPQLCRAAHSIKASLEGYVASPMEIDAISTHPSTDFPPSPDFSSISALVSSSLNSKKYYPGRNLYEKNKEDLRKIMMMNSPAVKLAAEYTPAVKAIKTTPLHNSNSRKTPCSTNSNSTRSKSLLYRGSMSSETVRREDDASRNDENVMYHEQVQSLTHMTTRNTSIDEETGHGKSHMVHGKPTSQTFDFNETSDNFLPEDALCNARALIDCNDNRITESRHCSQEVVRSHSQQEIYVMRKHSSSQDDSYNMHNTINRNNHCLTDPGNKYISNQVHHQQALVSSDTLRPSRSNLHPDYIQYSRTGRENTYQGSGDMILGNSYNQHNSAATCRSSEYNRRSLQDHNYNLQKENYKFKNDKYTIHMPTAVKYDHEYNSVNTFIPTKIHHGDGNWHSSNKGKRDKHTGNFLTEGNKGDFHIDILDSIDRGPSYSKSYNSYHWSDPDYNHNPRRNVRKAKVCHGTPDSDGSPTWSFTTGKPEPLSESPEKMYPRKI